MSAASQGRAREHRTRDILTESGWIMVMRAAASKGPADLLMGHPHHGAALIQVGTRNKRLDPDDRNRLCDAADLCGALALLATLHRGKLTVHIVDRGKPGDWARLEEVGGDE